MTDEQAFKLLQTLDAHAAAEQALIEFSIQHRCPDILGAVDVLFGSGVRPMLPGQVSDYGAGYLHACATFGVTGEDEREREHGPMLDCQRFFGPVFGPDAPRMYEHSVVEIPRKRRAEDQKTIDHLARLLKESGMPAPYAWYLLGRLTRLLVWPTVQPETADDQDSFHRGRWALPSDGDQELLEDGLWGACQDQFPVRVVYGPEEGFLPGVRYQ